MDIVGQVQSVVATWQVRLLLCLAAVRRTFVENLYCLTNIICDLLILRISYSVQRVAMAQLKNRPPG